jgi:hypothetical protein
LSTDSEYLIDNKRFFIFLILVIATFIIDILLVKIYDIVDKYFIPIEAKSIIFAVNTALCLTFQFGMIKYLQSIIEQQQLVRIKIKSFYMVSLISLIVSSILIGFLTFQMFYYKEFKTVILIIFIATNYGIGSLLMLKLDILFFRWFRLYHNLAVLLYFIAILLIIFNLIVTAVYASIRINDRPPETRQFVGGSIDISIAKYPNLQTIHKISSILSFASMWLATSVLLINYRHKSIKTIAYWFLLSIPLIYFLINYFSTFIFKNVLFPYLNDPITSALILTAFLTLSKPIGGLTFAILFWKMSQLVSHEKSLRLYLIISGFGVFLIFSADQAATLSLVPYPPFGLATISILCIGAYMMLVGIYNSATLVAKDKELRKEFYRNAMSQLDLLRAIGVTEMEKELIKNYKSIEKRIKSPEMRDRRFERDEAREILHDIVDDLDKDNVREILHDVLTEVYVKSKTDNKS